MPSYKGKGKAPMRDDERDDEQDNEQDSRSRQMSRPSSRQPSAEHYQWYPDLPPVLPSSINIRDFAYEGPVERPEISHIWAPELVAEAYAAASWAAGAVDVRNDQQADSPATSTAPNDSPATPSAVARATMNEAFDDESPPSPTVMGRTPYAGSFDPQDSSLNSWGWDSEDVPERHTVTFTAGRAQDHAADEDQAPSPATSAPTRDIVPLDPYEFPFDSHPWNLPNFPEGVAAPSRCSSQEDDRASRDEVVPSTSRVLRYISSLRNRSSGDLRDGELSPRSRAVDDAAGASSRIPEGVVRASRISRYTQTPLSIDNEPSPRTQQLIDPLDNANSWIPEGVAGPSTMVRHPTPQREPQRYSDIDTLMQSRNDSGQGEETGVDDAVTQQVILRSLQTTAIVVNPAAVEGEYGSDALENYTLPSSSSDDSSESSEGLVMAPSAWRAPYQALRRRLSPTPTPHVSPQPFPHLTSAGLSSPPHSPTLMLYRASSLNNGSRSSSSSDESFRLREPSPGLPRTQALEAERRAMERLRIYASMEDPTAQDLLAGYERRVDDWLYGHTQDHHGIFLTRRPEPSRLPHGYTPRFARWALELVEQQRETWDLFLLSVDDDRHFVLPHSTHAPFVSERPVLSEHFRTTSVPPTSRNHADVEVLVRARSTPPGLTQAEVQPNKMLPEEQPALQPHIETPSPNLAAAFLSTQRTEVSDSPPSIETPSPTLAAAFMSTQNTDQPTTQPTGQDLESGQASSSRSTRDSVVSTSVGTERSQSTSYLLTLIDDPPNSVPDEEQFDVRPPTEVLLFLYVVASMFNLDTRRPVAQPAGQGSEIDQTSSSRDARDSIVRTSVGTGEKTDGLEVVSEEREEAAV